MAERQRNGKFSLNGKFGQNGKLGHSCVRVTRVRDRIIVHLGLNVSSSAHNCGCMVDGGNTMAAISVLLLYCKTCQQNNK